MALKTARTPAEISFVSETELVANEGAAFQAINKSSSMANKLILESTENPPELPNEASTADLEIVSHTNNERRLKITPSKPGWLIFRQSYHPGWKAIVNGHETKIYHGNYSSMAIPILKSDAQTIEFRFSSPAWTRGLYLTLFGMISALFILIKFRHSRAD